MTQFDADAYRAVVDAVENEEGRMAPKKRLAVLAALECFSEYGYDGTSTKMIAERAGIGEATIFRHFPSKKALLMRIATPVVRHLLAPWANREAREVLGRHKDDPRAILEALLLSRLRFMSAHAPLVRILLQETLVDGELRAMLAREAGPLLVQLRDAVPMLGPASERDKDRIFRMIAASVLGYFVQRTIMMPDAGWDDEVEARFMVTVLLDGMSAALAA